MSASAKVIKPIGLLIAALIVTFTLMSVKRAMAAVLVPNAALFGYNLANGASAGPFFPPANAPALVMGCCNTPGNRGVGQVSILRVGGQFLEWVGLNSTAAGTITQGFSAAPGTHIVQIDFSGGVNINVNGTDTYVVTNTSGANQSGFVTMIW